MNDAQFVALGAYVRDLADRMLLKDWEITTFREPPEQANAYASIAVEDVENTAYVRVCDHFFEYSAEKQREWVTHELVHCHLDRPDRVVSQLAEQFSDNTATQFAKEAHHKEMEVCTQRFARLLAPLMPLPELPPGVHY